MLDAALGIYNNNRTKRLVRELLYATYPNEIKILHATYKTKNLVLEKQKNPLDSYLLSVPILRKIYKEIKKRET